MVSGNRPKQSAAAAVVCLATLLPLATGTHPQQRIDSGGGGGGNSAPPAPDTRLPDVPEKGYSCDDPGGHPCCTGALTCTCPCYTPPPPPPAASYLPCCKKCCYYLNTGTGGNLEGFSGCKVVNRGCDESCTQRIDIGRTDCLVGADDNPCC
jgi:hypothetical protein